MFLVGPWCPWVCPACLPVCQTFPEVYSFWRSAGAWLQVPSPQRTVKVPGLTPSYHCRTGALTDPPVSVRGIPHASVHCPFGRQRPTERVSLALGLSP